jgi:site-specific DNA-methyltransferase (adenine-specific)
MLDSLKGKITLGDSLKIIKNLPDKCIDLVFTDPPYGIGMDRNAGKSDKYTNKTWDNERPTQEMFNEILRVSKEQIIFGGNYFIDMLPLASWAVWDKRCGVIPERSFADGELLYISYKKPMRIFRYIWDGMLQQCMKEKDVRFHPTQKPLKLCEQILKYYLPEKENLIVADFYSGSGTIAVACHNLKLDFIAIEKDEEYYEKSCNRLDNAKRQLKLF